MVERWWRVLFAAIVLATTASCRSADPACRDRTAADVLPTASAYRAMSAVERRDEARRFNELAQRCGWEP